MALLWIDGFEGYGTSIGNAPSPSGVCGRRYPITLNESLMDIETGRVTGFSIEFNGVSNALTTPTLTTNDTLIAGVGFRTASSGESYILVFWDEGTLGMNLRWQPGGEVRLYRGVTTIATTSGLNLLLNTWYHFEMKIKCHDTTGEYEIKVNESTVLSATGVDTKAGSNNYHDVARLYSSNTVSRFDDFYVCDSSGSENNDFLGNCKVVAIYPDGDDTANWTTVSPGPNHYEAVDEEIVDDDTSYVEDSTTNTTDLYDFTALPSLATIKGLQINVDCRETDAATFDIEIPIESNSSQYDGSPQTVGSTNWVTRSRIEDTDPDTGNLWTEAGINAAKFGIKVG
jgi:hypothetical protein